MSLTQSKSTFLETKYAPSIMPKLSDILKVGNVLSDLNFALRFKFIS